VAARSRVVSARQQLQRTGVRAPFDGVVSERKASAGDTVQVGKELLKVIDPRSMRFDGLVSADRMSELKIGQTVSFRVNGYTQGDFTGKVRRIDAEAAMQLSMLFRLWSGLGIATVMTGMNIMLAVLHQAVGAVLVASVAWAAQHIGSRSGTQIPVSNRPVLLDELRPAAH